MKVLVFVTQFYQPGGAERLGLELAEQLNKRDVEADILSMYSDHLPGGSEAEMKLHDHGVRQTHYLGMDIHPSIWALIPAVRKLKALIRQKNYDIIETSSISSTIIASWATLFGSCRQVVGVHQVFLRNRENSWKHFFWRLSLRCNQRVRYYGVTEYVSRAWCEYLNISNQHVRTVYNAIPDESFKVRPDRAQVMLELGVPLERRVILYAGRLARYKGCSLLLSALLPVMESENLHLLFAGELDRSVSGSEEMLRMMETDIQAAQLEDRVAFLGYRTDISRLMASVDLLAHPTQMEGFGLSLVEALAAGAQVVSTNVEGIPEVMEGTSSILVSPDDETAMREAILTTLKRPEKELIEAIERGRRVAEKYKIDNRVDSLIGAFEDVLQE
jgi:glycosyltransferase involved in cell wall biosynthesis